MVMYNDIREVSIAIRVDECNFIGRTESRGGGMILPQVNCIDALQAYIQHIHVDDVYEILGVTINQ